MEQESLFKPIRVEDLPEFDDDEFCVSITKAAELSGITESQIRYFESLQGVNIGKRGPKERNRVYTKQDVKLLWWVAQHLDEYRPSEIADYLKEHQEEVLGSLGRFTLKQVVEHEEMSSGHDVLVSRLVALILSMWQEAALGRGKKADAVIRGVIFGPQDKAWKDSFTQSVNQGRSIDMADSLVIWSTVVEEEHKDFYVDPEIIFGNINIVYSHQSWYLPPSKKHVYDTSHFSDPTEPFAVAILWLPLDRRTDIDQLKISAQNVNELKKKLAGMLMQSLSYVLDRTPGPTSFSSSVFSRGILGRQSVRRGLTLLLDTCIEPHFSDSFSYIAKYGIGKYGSKDQLEMLETRGNEEVGYLPKVLADQDLPWWIKYVKKSASIALAEDATTTHYLAHKSEYGSVVCFPLIALDNVVGVMGIENVNTDFLVERKGLTDADLLRYLICISEIAAEYLNLMESSAQKAERSKLAYASEETVSWWLDVYRYGGSNYSRFIEKVCCWMEEMPLAPDDEVNLIVIDIFKESDLAAKYQGFELIIEIINRTRARITELIQKDPIAGELTAKKQLLLFDSSVGEHLLLATAGIPRDYLLIFLEKIRRFWQKEAGDFFIWKGNTIDVALQVGICRIDSVAGYKREMAFQIMNYHLGELVSQIYEKDERNQRPLNHVIEYNALIQTERVYE